MREKILNILGHLSQSLQKNKDLFYDADEIWDELASKGYSDTDIADTLNHLEKTTLAIPGPFWSDSYPVYRVYTSHESSQVSRQARGYLWKLKVRGIIDHALEDEIIQKVMHLENTAGLREIKTVAALTVFGYEHKTQGFTEGFSSDHILN